MPFLDGGLLPGAGSLAERFAQAHGHAGIGGSPIFLDGALELTLTG